METKKIRNKRKKKPFKIETANVTQERCYDCECKRNNRSEIKEGVKPHTSRVRIYGCVGLTPDERYVVDCEATVDENSSK